MPGTSRPINILLVEDNPDDVELTKRALTRAKVKNQIWTVTNGLDALAFLRGQPPHQDAPRPDLVLLDLNLPGLDGRDVLLRIREDPQLRGLAVVVLTASDEEREHLAALAADAFLTKPVDLDRLGWLVRVMANLGWAIVKTDG
jgi:CheY-like chemotaxis protein